MKTSPDTKELFLKISVHLTGFSEIELRSTGMVEKYFDIVTKKEDPINVKSFFAEVRLVIDTKPASQITTAIGTRLVPDSKYYGLAKRIILLWYTGIWTTAGKSEMVNSDAFVEGLIWKAAETHPAGAKQPGYDSWTRPPLT